MARHNSAQLVVKQNAYSSSVVINL